MPPQCVDPKTKNRSRLHYWLADKQSQAVDPAATSLLLDLDGNLTECSGANFVVVENDAIFTPTSRNILEGVSLVTLRELAPELGLGWVEKNLQPYDAVNADEAWLTSTPYCLAPCTRINNTPIGDGKPGPSVRAGDGGVESAGGDGTFWSSLKTRIEKRANRTMTKRATQKIDDHDRQNPTHFIHPIDGTSLG